jgi:hypothetical protein
MTRAIKFVGTKFISQITLVIFTREISFENFLEEKKKNYEKVVVVAFPPKKNFS